MPRNRLWLLAHQDDEVLGLHLHSKLISNHILYLTDGVRIGANYNSDKRISEAQMSWNEIDKNAELIFFGTDHSLKDGALNKEVNLFHFNKLIAICRDRKIKEIVTLQLEGGHQDHDIVSMLAEELASRLGVDLITFPAYRALHKKYPFYIVMSPTHRSKEKTSQSIVLRVQIAKQSFNLMKYYRSQLTTWIGLGPFVMLRYLLGDLTFVQNSKLTNANQIAPSKILYVNRNKERVIDYEGFRKKISDW
jgi:hypothetical protein